jgi:hypothetical protein
VQVPLTRILLVVLLKLDEVFIVHLDFM